MLEQMVVSRFDEKIDWVLHAEIPTVVYDKGGLSMLDDLEAYKTRITQGNIGFCNIPNVGRESHTYLFHIIENYNNLADTTLFTQANPNLHFNKTFDVLNLLKAGSGISGMRLATGLREWGPDGRLLHWGKWLDQYNAGELKRSDLSMTDWFRLYLELDINALGSLAYFPGAIFAISKDVLLRRPKEFYEMLLGTLSHHHNPEEAYYCERGWLYMFGRVDVNYVTMTGNGKGLER